MAKYVSRVFIRQTSDGAFVPTFRGSDVPGEIFSWHYIIGPSPVELPQVAPLSKPELDAWEQKYRARGFTLARGSFLFAYHAPDVQTFDAPEERLSQRDVRVDLSWRQRGGGDDGMIVEIENVSAERIPNLQLAFCLARETPAEEAIGSVAAQRLGESHFCFAAEGGFDGTLAPGATARFLADMGAVDFFQSNAAALSTERYAIELYTAAENAPPDAISVLRAVFATVTGERVGAFLDDADQ